MKRGKVYRVAERGRTCGGYRGEEGHSVGNGVDRGHVGIVDDDRGLFPSLSWYKYQLQPECEVRKALMQKNSNVS